MSRSHGSKMSTNRGHVNMAEKKKETKKLKCLTFMCMILLRNRTVAHFSIPSFDNVNSRLDQERVLRSRNFATVYLGTMTSHLYPLLLIIFNYCLYSLILCSHPADPRLHWTFGPKNGLVQWTPCYYDMLHGPSVH